MGGAKSEAWLRIAYKRIIWVVARLRYEDDGNGTTGIAFQTSRVCSRSLRSLWVVEVLCGPLLMLLRAFRPPRSAYLGHVP